MVLEDEGNPVFRERHTKSSDVILYCNEEDTFPQDRVACHHVFAPRLQSKDTSRSYRFLPLLRAMQATGMANS